MFIQDRIDNILNTVYADTIRDSKFLIGSHENNWKDLLIRGYFSFLPSSIVKNTQKIHHPYIAGENYGLEFKISTPYNKGDKDFSYTYSITYHSGLEDVSEKILFGEIRPPKVFENFYCSPMFMIVRSKTNETKFKRVLASDIDELESEIKYYYQSLLN